MHICDLTGSVMKTSDAKLTKILSFLFTYITYNLIRTKVSEGTMLNNY